MSSAVPCAAARPRRTPPSSASRRNDADASRSVTRSRAGRAGPRRGASPCARARAGRGAPRGRAAARSRLRAAVPTARTIRPPLPTRIPFCDSVSAHTWARDHQQAVLALLDLVDLDLDGVRQLLARAQQDLLAHELGEPHLGDMVGVLVRRVEERALRQQLDQRLHDSATPVPVLRADREDLALDAELGGGRRARSTVRARSSRSTLFSDGDGRHAGSLDRLGDEAVARPDLLLAVQHEQRGVGVAPARAPSAAASAR